jgi:hypothetical protein
MAAPSPTNAHSQDLSLRGLGKVGVTTEHAPSHVAPEERGYPNRTAIAGILGGRPKKS